MGLERVDPEFQSGLGGRDERIDDAAGSTLRSRMPNRVMNGTRTPDAAARTHNPIGKKRKKIVRMIRPRITSTNSMAMLPESAFIANNLLYAGS